MRARRALVFFGGRVRGLGVCVCVCVCVRLLPASLCCSLDPLSPPNTRKTTHAPAPQKTRPPANANAKVVEAFKILTGDPQVKAIMVNIFGGIMKCDVIASGIVNAARQVGVRVPLIVRLEGTNVERGKEIIKSSGIDITTADDLNDAATKAVASIA